MPEAIIPPMAPMRMTGMGISSPRPISMGLRTLSLAAASTIHTAKILAEVVS